MSDPQDDPPEDAALRNPLMGLRRLRQRIDRGERHLEPGLNHRGVEPFELTRTRDCVVHEMVDAATTRFRFDSVRVGDPPTRPDEIETSLEPFASRERKRRVERSPGDDPKTVQTVWAPGVDRLNRAQATDERPRVATRSGPDHARPATPGELYGEGPDAA